ncbi:hypothetical protein HJC23_013893 [Cyclotella cryptica]|uniref:Uncharacterized protein n=1 Tax=Cyclotella cryptica TaxID=29204 RepID=A0ABD3QHQ5_9STRA|eukprot:CCRYP_005500-RA/>CCRYP_005500-RA protein AED:0.07 eAED:0.07 QI:327/1/1/1/0/0/2/72/540
MFGKSPLSSAVAQGSPSVPPPRPFFSDSCLSAVERDECSKTSADEEVLAGYGSSSNNPLEEYVKADASHSNKAEGEGRLTSDASTLGVQEPSAPLQMVDDSAEPRVDPPEDVAIPDDDPQNKVCKVTSGSIIGGIDSRDDLNAIVYDVDKQIGGESPPGEQEENPTYGIPEVVSDPARAKERVISKISCHDSIQPEKVGRSTEIDAKLCDAHSEAAARPTWQKEFDWTKSMVHCESKGPMLICLYSYSFFYRNNNSDQLDQEYGANESKEENKDQEETMNKLVDPQSEISVETEDKENIVQQVVPSPHDGDIEAKESNGESEAVSPMNPEREWFKSLIPVVPLSKEIRQSYYDIHKANYMESAKYMDQHSNLVKYIEDWEHILFQRVHVLYTEYMKHRKNFYHYAKKVGSLKKEMARLQKASGEKHKPVPPKKMEKLKRNVIKLTGARDTHDHSGESLFLFLDEVVNRSWRDMFPLFQRAVKFDQDYSAMQAKQFQRLTGTTELLDLIGRNKSISMSSRLKLLTTLNPEVIYSGEQVLGI